MVGGTRPDDHAPAPGFREEIRTCRVERWRGYITSRFYVFSDDGSVFESKPFRWRRAAPPPESKRARASYEELVARLESEGWSRFEQGPVWYATTFVQTVRVPVPPGQQHAPVPIASVPAPRTLPLPREAAVEKADEPEVESGNANVSAVAGQPGSDLSRRAHPRWRRRSLVMAVPVAGVVGAAAFLLGGGHAAGSPPVVRHAPPARNIAAEAPTPPPSASKSTAPKATTEPRLVDLRIVAHAAGSWIEIRRGSERGQVLYRGVLADGKRLRFREPRLWAQVGAAGNLSITADGKPVLLRGTLDKLFRPSAG